MNYIDEPESGKKKWERRQKKKQIEKKGKR